MTCENKTKVVKFFLPARYFQPHRTHNGMTRRNCIKVLTEALGVQDQCVDNHMCSRPEGFWIVCSPEQFSSFIILRNKYGKCINGIKDLRPEYLDEKDPVGNIAKRLNCGQNHSYISTEMVQAVLDQLETLTFEPFDTQCIPQNALITTDYKC